MNQIIDSNAWNYGGYLQHFGIKGQKWGIRRFQNEDRSFTEAGKRRYYPERNPFLIRKVKPASEKDITALNKRISEANTQYKRAANLYAKNRYYSHDLVKEKSFLAYHEAEKRLKDLQILKKLQGKKYISQHQLNIAQKYKDQGMSDEQAKIQAYKRVRTEKILAAAAVTTVGMAALHVAKLNRANLDSIISKGTRIQNLSSNPDKGVHDAFFASYTPEDNQKYLGLFGGDHMQKEAKLMKLFGVGTGKVEVSKLTAEAVSNVNIAGANTARDLAGQLISNNKDYRNALTNILNHPDIQTIRQMPGGLRGYDNLREALNGGKLNSEGYNLVNRLLVVHDPNGNKAGNILYEALKSKGYDGTVDINDIFNSGYNAKRPVIIFNGGAKLGNVSRTMIDPDSLKFGALIENGKVFLRQALDFYGPMAAAATAAIKLADSKIVKTAIYKRRIIKDYKRKHPNTQLTDSQIVDTILTKTNGG